MSKHHGSLHVESEPGDTRFQVLLPLTASETGTEAETGTDTKTDTETDTKTDTEITEETA